MDLKEIQYSWQALDQRLDKLEYKITQADANCWQRKSEHLQHKLRNRYFFQATIGFLLPLISPLLCSMGLPLWTAIAYGAVGIILGAMNLCLASYIGKNNYITLPIVEALQHAVSVRTWQYRTKCVGLIILTMLIMPLFYELYRLDEIGMLIGATAGLIIGLWIGIHRYVVSLRMSRSLINTLKQLKNDE